MRYMVCCVVMWCDTWCYVMWCDLITWCDVMECAGGSKRGWPHLKWEKPGKTKKKKAKQTQLGYMYVATLEVWVFRKKLIDIKCNHYIMIIISGLLPVPCEGSASNLNNCNLANTRRYSFSRSFSSIIVSLRLVLFLLSTPYHASSSPCLRFGEVLAGSSVFYSTRGL